MTEVKATANWKTDEGEEKSRSIALNYDFGDNVNAMIEEVGAEAVYHHAKSSMTVALQNAMRSWLSAGHTDEEIQGEKVDQWQIPTGRPRAANRMEKVSKLVEKMSPEERATLLASLGE